jgi:para-nitrobenzyl esterase
MLRSETAMQRPVLLVLVLAAAVVACGKRDIPAPVADPSSVRVPPAGPIAGFLGEYASHAWLGIPYAEAPEGALRWRAPRPAPRWTETRLATSHGAMCPQIASPFGGVDDVEPGTVVGDEDCLSLNIYAPDRDPGEVPQGEERWPVMFWIHGGGNVIGTSRFYDGGNLAQSRDVVVVTVNYRLGPLGWFRNAALRERAADDVERSGNFALLDEVLALEWVRDNISAFGGNPDNVTIFGESAGGTNVYSLLLSPLAKGLFHRAIVQSGGTHFSTLAEGENDPDADVPGDENSSGAVIVRWLLDAGKAEDPAAARAWVAAASTDETLGMLRERKLAEIFEAYRGNDIEGLFEMPKLFRDGVTLPADDPAESLARSGGYNEVPVMLGTNRDEMKLFMFGDERWVRRTLGIFFRIRDPQRYNLYSEYVSNMWKATGVDEPAAAMRRVQGPSVYAYRFDWDDEPTVLGADLSEMLGAGHALEIPFVFGHFNLGRAGEILFNEDNADRREALSRQMSAYWTEFAYTGAPGRGRDRSLTEWAAWDDSSDDAPKFMLLDTAQGGGLRMSSQTESSSGLLARAASDPRVESTPARCEILRGMAEWSGALTREDYERGERVSCADYPWDEWPWDE